MKKRLLSMLMALCLMATMVPAAFAANETIVTEEQLKSAIANAAAGETVQIGADITLSESLVVDKAITIDGAGHTLDAGSFTAVKITASGVTLNRLNILTDGHGVHFDASKLSEAPTLDLIGCNIAKKTVDSQTGVCYSTDNRGLYTSNVKGGSVSVDSCSIIGFKYAINTVVSPDGALRDGEGTIFDIFNSVVKGWAALNIWSANTDYYLTDSTMVGVNNLSGDSNGYSVIEVNHGIYGNSAADVSSSVNISGGSLVAVKYGDSDQTVFNVDNEYRTDFVFDSENPVSIRCYRNDNTTSLRVAHVWNFYYFDYIVSPDNAKKKAEKFMKDHVTGYSDGFVTAGPLSEYEDVAALTARSDDQKIDFELAFENQYTGGMQL